MNRKPIEHAKDPDLRHSLAALRRAAARAREVAAATHTALVVVRNGAVELIDPAPTERIQEHRPSYLQKP